MNIRYSALCGLLALTLGAAASAQERSSPFGDWQHIWQKPAGNGPHEKASPGSGLWSSPARTPPSGANLGLGRWLPRPPGAGPKSPSAGGTAPQPAPGRSDSAAAHPAGTADTPEQPDRVQRLRERRLQRIEKLRAQLLEKTGASRPADAADHAEPDLRVPPSPRFEPAQVLPPPSLDDSAPPRPRLQSPLNPSPPEPLLQPPANPPPLGPKAGHEPSHEIIIELPPDAPPTPRSTGSRPRLGTSPKRA